MIQEIVQIDSFTDTPFAGNPAAVCLLPEPRSDDWMQHIALEMNLSETAFLVKKDNAYQLRWFTPNQEIDFCGHATLAAAFYLFEKEDLTPDQTAKFQTRVGTILVRKNGDWLDMDFPSFPPERTPVLDDIRKALRVSPTYFGKVRNNFLIEVSSEEILRGIKPDFARLEEATEHGVIVTAKSSRSGWDFVSRYFAPAVGIDEDPVTGSAHATLGPYWSVRFAKDQLVGYQASQRGGTVRVLVKGERVIVSGQAVMVMRGTLLH